jgi:hypothetical protein
MHEIAVVEVPDGGVHFDAQRRAGEEERRDASIRPPTRSQREPFVEYAGSWLKDLVPPNRHMRCRGPFGFRHVLSDDVPLVHDTLTLKSHRRAHVNCQGDVTRRHGSEFR